MTYGIIMDSLRKAGFVDEDGRICSYNNDEIYIEDFFCDLFENAKEVTSYRIDTMDAFDSPGYDCSVLSAAWVDERGLQLETFLIESC